MPSKRGLRANLNGPSAAEVERLDTFMPEIAGRYVGHLHEEAGGGFRAGENRAVVINPNGSFHDFRDNAHGYGGISLIAHLAGVDDAAAEKSAAEWLSQHAGNGSLSIDDVAEDAAQVRRDEDISRQAFINRLWTEAKPIAGTAAVAYLLNRGLKPDKDDLEQLRWLPNARGAEGAMLAAGRDENGNLVVLQATYIDPAGRKSDVQPVRRTFRGPRDWGVRGFVRFGKPAATPMTICEGLEDALSARAAGAQNAVALLGLNRLGRVMLPDTVEEVVFVRDDDRTGSTAQITMARGVIRLMGQGRKVLLTPLPSAVAGEKAPPLKDINDLLQHDRSKVDELLNKASKPRFELSDPLLEAVLDEASFLPGASYERGREQIADAIGFRLPRLDDMRTARIADRADDDEPDQTGGIDETPWLDPVLDIGAVMDVIVTEVGRYVRTEPHNLHAVALWTVFAHLIHRIDLRINISPRLSIQSASSDSGKTTLLELLACLTPRSSLVGSTSVAAIFRKIALTAPTLLIDEADNILHSDASPELKAVLNSGHRRSTAYVERVEKNDKGQWGVVRFPIFTAIAFAGLNRSGKERMPETLLNRSVVVSLRMATAEEQPEHLIDGESAVLFEMRRKIARWVADLSALPRVDRPKALLNRRGDNWYSLRQAADLAGGEWPKRAMTAATSAWQPGAKPGELNEVNALLEDIWQVLYDKRVTRIHTRELIPALLEMSEGRWNEANHGKPITEQFIASRLKGTLPTDEEVLQQRRWRKKSGATLWGYTEDVLRDAFRRHLGKEPPSATYASKPSKNGETSDARRAGANKEDVSEAYSASEIASQPASQGTVEVDDASQCASERKEGVLDAGPDAGCDAEFREQDQSTNGNASRASEKTSDKDPFREPIRPRGATRRKRPQERPTTGVSGHDE
jgi:hypothetical protein